MSFSLKKRVIEVKTPGKLFLSGEWSILESSNPGIVVAINKYVTAQIQANENIEINLENINLKNIKACFKNNTLYVESKLVPEQKEKFYFTKKATEIALRYLSENNIIIKNFKLSINSEISKIKLNDGSSSKIGLGSSSATVVAIISAILKFHSYEIKSLKAKKIIFKLAVIAHYLGQNKFGSGADIAACTYKQPLIYKKFDPFWLEKETVNMQLKNIVSQTWPNLQITPIRLPKELILCVAFVGYGASTQKLIPQILKLKKENKTEYNQTIISISDVVEELIKTINEPSSEDQKEKIIKLIKKNKDLLKQFYPQLETYELTKLIDVANSHGAAAKFSGAGGGDCGIAICFDKQTAEKIKLDWKKEGMYPLDIEILNK